MATYSDEIKLLLIKTRPHTNAQEVFDLISSTAEINDDEAYESRMTKFISDNPDLGSWTETEEDGFIKREFTPPTDEELKAKLIEKEWTPVDTPQPWQIDGFESKAAWDAAEYQRNRAIEYPSIEDQLDEIYHNGIDAWKAKIKETKDKYPKG